jgi:hypothetical protein
MLSTKLLISDINDVPNEWIFEKYCDLQEKLSGQDVMIKSILGSKDKVPSFNIFWSQKKNKYWFHDHSTGRGGSAMDLVMMIHDLTFGQAVYKVIEDYNEYILLNGCCYSIKEFREHARYKVTGFTKRKWNTLDQSYWMQYEIGSSLLAKYNVCALEDYTMEKHEFGEDKKLTIKGYHIYGFFRKDGTMYKIYQPKVKDKKFIKVGTYIQGSDQLTFTHPTLVICSSLKDLMDFDKMGFDTEQIAPDSENTLIPGHMITGYKMKFRSIFTLFDYDKAGQEAMLKYEEKYHIPSIHLHAEKDLSDTVAKYGLLKTRNMLLPIMEGKLKLVTT